MRVHPDFYDDESYVLLFVRYYVVCICYAGVTSMSLGWVMARLTVGCS